jgi:hypothetical protein
MAKLITYWIATLWLSLGMVSTAAVQLFNIKTSNDFITPLGYPPYALKILGVWKILGVIAILLPRLPLLKEWAYAGFFFAMSGAAISHLIMHNSFGDLFPSLLSLLLVILSGCFRPPGRKLNLDSGNPHA